MSSTSIFPPSAEPPGGRALIFPRSSLPDELLITIGRYRRSRWREQRAEDAGLIAFGYADPPGYLSSEVIATALPRYPPRLRDPIFSDTDFDPYDPTMLATAWSARIAEQLDEFGLQRLVRGVRSVACGFVAAGGQVSFGLICYVNRAALAQRAPVALTVDDTSFPIVLRPVPRDFGSAGGLAFPLGLAVGSARLGTVIGTLTAAHVVALDGDGAALVAGQRVQCCGSGCASHQVLRADAVMDAALVETGPATGYERVLRTMPIPGYFPVEMIDPAGNLVQGWVTEVPLAEGVIPGSRGRRPTSSAMLTLSFTGAPGWSGGLVLETQSRQSFGVDGQPYGMFLGVRQLRTALVGRMNMLAQLEKVWGIELVEE